MLAKHPEVRAASAETKKPIRILRERRGGVPRELVEANRRRKAVRERIIGALGSGPKTVPELAHDTGIPGDIVFWHVMGMKKYGLVVEGEERDGYYEYALKKE